MSIVARIKKEVAKARSRARLEAAARYRKQIEKARIDILQEVTAEQGDIGRRLRMAEEQVAKMEREKAFLRDRLQSERADLAARIVEIDFKLKLLGRTLSMDTSPATYSGGYTASDGRHYPDR